jgi:RNA polymerase sigma factor (sigma-70 family)
MSDDISIWLDRLVQGDPMAADVIWRCYWEKLVTIARQKLKTSRRRVADEEDVALSAFNSFCRGAADGRFPDLKDRLDLWKILVTITARKASAQHRREHAQKRGDRDVRGESVFGHAENESGDGIEDFVALEPSPEFAAMAVEQCAHLLAKLNESQRKIALLRLEGYRLSEIADQMDCVPATVRRQIHQIQMKWTEEE